MTSAESPHLATTERSGTVALSIGLLLALVGFLLWNEAQNKFSAEWGANVLIPQIVGYLAASLFVAAAGLIAAGLVVLGRARASAGAEPSAAPPRNAAPDDEADAAGSRIALPPDWLAEWPQVIATILLGACGVAAVVTAWMGGDQRALSPQTQQILGSLFILLAFPFLVLERIYGTS